MAKSDAERQRDRRARRSGKLMQLTIVIPGNLPLELVEHGYLDEWDDNDKTAIAEAIERFLVHTLIAPMSQRDG